jgi:hypothetical protein
MRKSTRNRTTRDFLKPKFKGKAYNIDRKKGVQLQRTKGARMLLRRR